LLAPLLAGAQGIRCGRATPGLSKTLSRFRFRRSSFLGPMPRCGLGVALALCGVLAAPVPPHERAVVHQAPPHEATVAHEAPPHKVATALPPATASSAPAAPAVDQLSSCPRWAGYGFCAEVSFSAWICEKCEMSCRGRCSASNQYTAQQVSNHIDAKRSAEIFTAMRLDATQNMARVIQAMTKTFSAGHPSDSSRPHANGAHEESSSSRKHPHGHRQRHHSNGGAYRVLLPAFRRATDTSI
jgi:hypothetical protein